jgi:hypothetical protein
MSRFLLAFDRVAGKLLQIRDAGDSAHDAMQARLDLEEKYAESSSVEVVVLSASSEEDLRRTHARYFESVEELVHRAAAQTTDRRRSPRAPG